MTPIKNKISDIMETACPDKVILPHEMFLIQLFVGAVVYIIGAGIRFWWLKNWLGKIKIISFFVLIVALFLSVSLSLLFLNVGLEMKVTIGVLVCIINLYAVLSELCLFAIQWLVFKLIGRKKYV